MGVLGLREYKNHHDFASINSRKNVRRLPVHLGPDLA